MNESKAFLDTMQKALAAYADYWERYQTGIIVSMPLLENLQDWAAKLTVFELDSLNKPIFAQLADELRTLPRTQSKADRRQRERWALSVMDYFADATRLPRKFPFVHPLAFRFLKVFVISFRAFANGFDALLLMHGMDLLRLQAESTKGVVLLPRQRHDVDAVARYVGSKELAQSYIDDLEETGETCAMSEDEYLASAKVGRPTREFATLVKDQSQTDVVMQCLAALLKGKSGKRAVLIIYTAVKIGLIDRPTHTEFVRAFDVGDMSKKTYSVNMPKNELTNQSPYTKNEIDGTAAALIKKLDEIKAV